MSDQTEPASDAWSASAFIDAMADGLYAVDRDRRILAWNPAATRLTGFQPTDVIGRRCGDGLLNHVDEQGEELCGDRCPLLATMADGAQRTTRAFVHHADGYVAPVRVTASPLRDATGAVVGAVETFLDDRDVRAVEDRLAEAERAALIDPLTGLGNRRHADALLAAREADWTREGRSFAVIAVDVDHFKQINDAHGHPVGDGVLSTLAQSLARTVRPGDGVFRVGGDEFLVITGPITLVDLSSLAGRLRTAVSASRYPGDPPVRVTISVGCALVREGDGASDVALRADERLFLAKRSGRDAVIVEPEPAPADHARPPRSRVHA